MANHYKRGDPWMKYIILLLCVGGVFAANFLVHVLFLRRPTDIRSAVTGNLRQLMTAGSQYMEDHHLARATYTDLVGPGTAYQLHTVNPWGGEDYKTLTMSQTTTQITISVPAYGTVTYSQ